MEILTDKNSYIEMEAKVPIENLKNLNFVKKDFEEEGFSYNDKVKFVKELLQLGFKEE